MNYTETLKTLQDYYSNLLIVQYHGKPKADATIRQLTQLIYSTMILMQIQNAFDWETATGKQLDIIGQWVGISRSYNVNIITQPKLAYLEYKNLYPNVISSAVQGGYSDYTTFSDNDGGFLRYNDLQSITNQLDDNNYRVVIGLKIIYNNIHHTSGEVDNAIWNYFGGLNLYSDADIALNTKLYSDKELTSYYGEIIDITSNIITVETEYGNNTYEYSYSNSIDDIYDIRLGNIYTTWLDNTIIYNYPTSYEEIMQICLYKGVLPAPIGTEIQLRSY